MKIQRGYKTELNLNNKQRASCLRHAGVARFAYNWGLARRIEEYKKTGKSSNAISQHKQLNKLKKTEFFWMYEVSKCAPQEALRDLDKAYKNLFTKRGGFPKFKSRRKGVGSFRFTGIIKVFNDSVQLPRLGRLKVKEKGYLPTGDVHILSATVSETAGRWFVSVQVEEEIEVQENNGSVAGVDLGITKLATVSDGMVFENPKALWRFPRKLRREQRRLSRKKKGSTNRKRYVNKVQKLHARIKNIRLDSLHQATSWLAKNKSVVAVEDLNVNGMLKNRCLSKAVSDVGMGEFLRQLKYKSTLHGSQVVVADRFFPSSKLCSRCGWVNDNLELSHRTYSCKECGLKIDRDFNASVNLFKLAVSSPESLNACERRKLWSVINSVVGETIFSETRTERCLSLVSNG